MIFDEELNSLKEKILKMGLLVESVIRDSIKSLVSRDSELAREVIRRDHQINALDVEIDGRGRLAFKIIFPDRAPRRAARLRRLRELPGAGGNLGKPYQAPLKA